MSGIIGTYRGCVISKLFPSGMYEAYTGETFRRADTIAGIREFIDDDLAGGLQSLDEDDAWIDTAIANEGY